MNRGKKILAILMAVFLIAGGYYLYRYFTQRGTDNLDNYPYEPDTPAPAAHTGTFVSEHGTLTFNGDGKSITVDLDEELQKQTGISSGSGTYVFLSGDLPPHGSIDVRYDIAHELEIRIGDSSVTVEVGIASADGKTATVGTNMVTETRIPFLLKDDNGWYTVSFEKKGG